ncbi:uncharacterized protein [Diadema antillarum]|uniref:uncharacterized protein n=1 Tax=Diadema antillarum TaxID=105358 RepID=UPI003A83C42B
MAEKKHAKTKKWSQKYKTEYSLQYPCIRKSERGIHHAYCTVCSVDISVEHGGRDDIRKHVGSKRHTDIAKERSSSTSTGTLLNYFTKQGTSEEEDVTRAELLFSGFIVEHNLPISVSDHAGPLFQKMFPDSKVASKYGCARTKTSAIIGELSNVTASSIADIARLAPFSLATDGSNDSGEAQLYPVLISYYDNSAGIVKQGLLSLPACKQDSTGENIFKLLDHEFSDRKIPWGNCVSFCADNASVMVGKHKGVAAYIHKQNPECYIMGCPCHMMHNTAKKAAQALPIELDDFLIDIYYYLDKSSKRVKGVKALQELCDAPTHKILKHVATRWLSLGQCIDRLIEQWEPLRLFFKEEVRRKMQPTVAKTLTTSKKDGTVSTASTGTAGSSTSGAAFTTTTAVSAAKKTAGTAPKPMLRAGSITGPSSRSSTKQIPSESRKTVVPSTGKEGPKLSSAFAKSLDRSSGSAKPSNQRPSSLAAPTSSSLLKRKIESGTTSLTSSAGSKRKCDRPAAKCTTSSTTKNASSSNTVQESREKRVNRMFLSPQTKLYCFFLRYANKLFEKGNLLLQRDEPCIHLLHRELNGLLKDIFVRFLKPSSVSSVALVNVPFSDRNHQKNDEDLMIGNDAKLYIREQRRLKKSTFTLSESDIQGFFSAVRSYYVKACNYIFKTWPLDDELAKHAQVLDVKLHQEVGFDCVEFFIKKFPCLFSDGDSDIVDSLESEFAHYQADASIPTIATEIVRVDEQWHRISQLTDPCTGAKKYPNLSKVMKGILVIPHSNASCERAFSLVRKNHTEFRPNLSVKTLEALLIEKLAHSTPCYQREYSKDIIRRAKKATQLSLSKAAMEKASSSSTSQ